MSVPSASPFQRSSHKKIIQSVAITLQVFGDPVVWLVYDGMTVKSPRERYSAYKCEREARNLLAWQYAGNTRTQVCASGTEYGACWY